MADYITVTDVSSELNGLSITSSTIPSQTTVETWIGQEQDILIRDTGKDWGEVTHTDEYLDYDGSGYIRTNYAPIISISSLEYESGGLNGTENWVPLTEGRGSANSFIIYKPEGELKIHGTTKPIAGFQNIKVSYLSGYEVVNKTVKAILAKRVAMRIISSVINGQSGEEGGNVTVGAISISDPSTFGLDRYKDLDNEVKQLYASLGDFKTYRYNRR